MHTVFISYSRKDAAFVHELQQALEQRSRDVWVDWEDIPPTAEWFAEICGAIEASDAFLFVISPDSVASPVCARELAHAVARNKRLIPLLRSDTPDAAVPPELARLNWVVFRPPATFDAGLASLLTAVDTDLEWVRTHTRLLVRAAEWDRLGREDSYLLRGADLAVAERWLAGADDERTPKPTPLHREYVLASQQGQARELERFQRLYRTALSRQLAAEAALLRREDDAMLDRAMLLAAESMQRVPNAAADRTLREGLVLRAEEVAAWQHPERCTALGASRDGRWLASAGADGSVVVRAVATLAEHARVTVPAGVAALDFDDAGALLAVGADDGTLLAVDVERGEERARNRHTGRVRAVRLTADGTSLLAAGAEGAALLALADGAVRWRLDGADVWTLAVSGRHVAVGASDCVVRLLRADTGEVVHELAHATERPKAILERGTSDAGIHDLAFTADGARLVSAGVDGTVRVWDVESGAERLRLEHDREVIALALDAGDTVVVSGSMDRTARVWDLATGAARHVLVHGGPVMAVALSDDGALLATASGDGTARLWELEGGDELARCVHGEWAGAVTFADGVAVVSGDDAGGVRAWVRGEPDYHGLRHGFAVKECVPSPDGRWALVIPDEKTLILYDLHASPRSWRLVPHPDFVDDVWLTADGRLITAAWDGLVRVFDAESLELRSTLAHDARVWSTALAADESTLATAVQHEPLVRVWRLGTEGGELLAELPHDRHVRGLSFSPDGSSLATSSDDGAVRVWDVAGARELHRFVHTGIAWCVAIDPTGTLVASGGEDGLVCVRDAGSGAPRLRLKHEVSIAGVTFSPDGRWLAARTSDVYGGRDLDVVVWDLTTGGEAARLRHEDHVHEVSWHPAGALVATASQDRRARVWTVPDFQEVTRLQFDDLVLCSRFTADGARLVTTSYDGWLRFTLVGAEALVERVLQRVPRRLTPDEWRQYLPGEPYPDATPEIAPALDGTPLPHE